MKWFFLPFIPLLAFVGNLALLSELTLHRVLGAVPFNLFVLSLASLWWHAYFARSTIRSPRLVVSHAVFMLSASMAIALVGVNIMLSDSCRVVLSSRGSRSLISSLAQYAESSGYCRELGVLFAILGAFLAYPSLRLLSSLRRFA